MPVAKSKDLRDFIALLEDKGELRRIKTPVSRDLEITEITDRTVKSGGPALLFENVEGYNIPLVINLFGTHQRVAWALGVDHVDELTQQVRKLLGPRARATSGYFKQSPHSGRIDRTGEGAAKSSKTRALSGSRSDG